MKLSWPHVKKLMWSTLPTLSYAPAPDYSSQLCLSSDQHHKSHTVLIHVLDPQFASLQANT